MTTLAYPFPSRQDLHSISSASPSPTTLQHPPKPYTPLNKAHSAKIPPSPLDLPYTDFTTDSYYLDSRQSTPSDQFNYCLSDSQFMQNSSAHYPEVRVQQSTPNNGLPPATPPPLVADDGELSSSAWNYHGASYLAPNQQQHFTPSTYRSHKRLSSGSSVGSTGPDSPYTQPSLYPHIVDPDTTHLENFDGSFSTVGQFAKPHYPTTAQHSDSSFYPAFQNFNINGNSTSSMMAGRTETRQDMPQLQNMSGGQASSRGSFNGEVDSSVDMRNNTIPNLDRTMSDIYQDELFNPSMSQPSTTSQPRVSSGPQGSALPAHRSALNDILQAANNGHLSARSASPATISARRSPFRDSSRYATTDFHSDPSSPAARLTSVAQMREQQKIESDAQAYAQHHQTSRHDLMNPPNTISPKEVALDYHESEEDAKLPLFPSPKHDTQRLDRGNTELSNDHTFGSMNTSRRQSSSNYSTSPGVQPSSSNFTFMPPSVPTMPQQYPFITRRASSGMQSGSDQIPEFPSTLSSMESTKSEPGQTEHVRIIPERSPPSSQEGPTQRPVDTSAGSGSYTCMSTDCHARFDTAAKLQKHRRENHRNSPTSATTPTTPSSATTPSYNQQAAANNVSRNNQPGPHKCEKTNPSTGKPCNTIFSRSYDLTRHEDTIHNNRKQKVRCHLCTEEKTFSRNDALTRHMRVVHPDVDFPGKMRRGRNNEGVDVVRQKIESGRSGR